MLTPVHNPASGKLRVIGYASGSGNTLWKAYELQKEMEQTWEGCPFEVVGVFSDNPQSKAVATAEKLGVPHVSLDIREYYKRREKPLRDRQVRREYDQEALRLLASLEADAILLAGYVWATTDALLDRYLMINVHPADLSIRKEGRRAYAGANGVGDALAAREPALCSTSHLATKEIDGGPILVISPRVSVDYNLHDDETERMRHYLHLVNAQNREVGARTLLEVALGHFSTDEAGKVYYKKQPAPTGIRIESWEENQPVFRRQTGKLLTPETVAVIGASNKPGLGRSVVENLLRDGFTGKVYAVNMRGEGVLGAKGYSSVGEIPGSVDLAVIATPSATVLDLAEQCGQKGVAALICISAGFKEVGAEGAAAQEKLLETVNRYNMRMIGPNCMGLMSAGANLNATMLTTPIVKGSVALVTQSGAIGAAMLDYAQELGMGFSSIVSLGNQADVNICDLLFHLDQDPHTKVIVLYLESILEPVRFWRLAAKVGKPILLIKAGSTSAGMAAASSHTGSLAGNDQIVQALIHKAGITRMSSLQEAFFCASALANMPRIQGNRVALLTNAGGPGILISDALSNLGFELPTPQEKLKNYLRENLMKEASVANPVDLVAPAPPEHYALAAKAMLESGEYDALLVCCVPPATVDTTKVAQALVPVLKDTKLPVLCNFFGPALGHGARACLRENGIPVAEYPEQLACMLAGMRQKDACEEVRAPRAMPAVMEQAMELLQTAGEGQYLPTAQAYELLRLFGVNAAHNKLLRTAEEAKDAGLAYPVVAKIDHPEIVHKSDVGGVRLHIRSDEELEEVVGDFLTRFPGANGVLCQEMVPDGVELIVGSALDPQLGHGLMVGLGGVWVEVMKDVAFAYPPVGRQEVLDLLNSLRCEPLLSGYRGKPGVDKQAMVQLLERLGAMLLALPGIAEIDLNPVIYDPAKGAFIAADVRIKKG